MKATFAQLSVTGPVRPVNEDSVGLHIPRDETEWKQRAAAMLIADGVGGQDAGEIASRMAVSMAQRKFLAAALPLQPAQVLWQMFDAAGEALYGRNAALHRDMATTLTIALLRDDQLWLGHVGDCRAYLVREGRARQLTHDHSRAAMQLKAGVIDEDEAARSRLRSILTRILGPRPVVEMDYHVVILHDDDRLVLCCDGLYRQVSESDLASIVTAALPVTACRQLVDAALAHGGEDNISVQVAHIQKVEPAE